MEKPFVIYRSSAGSGKTYTLALEYLKLALQSPSTFRNILAVTFTNKATREMKGRIIQFLYELANDKNPVLREVLEPTTGLQGIMLRDRARQVLSAILHGYAYFSVMTIDSFFQKVIRAFAREMGLQAGFAVELDQEKVLDEVIDGLLSELGEPQHQLLREWLVRFSEEKVESGKAWDFRRDVKQLARELFKEEYKLLQDGKEEGGQDNTHYQNVLSQLKAIVKTFENSMQSYGKEGLYMMEAHGLAYTDFAYGKSGVGNYFVRLAEKIDFDPKKRGREAAEDAEKWTTKTSKKKEQILEVVGLGLQAILNKAVSQYDREFILYQSAHQLLKFIYAYGILRDIGKKLEDYKRENDLMLISDASIFLRDIIGKDETPFIYEKIGSSFQHFLIDEFQDTSGMQWDNFRPLIENSLDTGNRNLVVGDVKQSIYRWRGGDWQLLLEKIQEDIPSWNTATFNLDMNFRSSKNIVDFNNWLFATLPSLIRNEISAKLEGLGEAERIILEARADIITHAYADVQQKLPPYQQTPEAWKGYVQMEMLEKMYNSEDEDEDSLHWKDQVKQRLPGLVESLQDQGYALRDIAFLVRDKKAGKEVVDTLIDYKSKGLAKAGYGYEVISSESLFLNASLTVSLLIDVLRILDHQQHAIAKGSAVYKYHKLRQKQLSSDELHSIFMAACLPEYDESASAFFRWLPSAFQELYPYLNKLPLYELVENLISIFALNQSDELAYLQAFQDAVLEYSGQETGDLYSFLKWWDEKGKETSVRVSEDVDAMRILTIHKSKGLQFKVVIIPFCDWELDHRTGQDNIIWTQTDAQPFNQFGLMPMRYSSKLTATYFSMDYYQEMIKAYIDNLNLLYVAFTRAEEALYTFSAPSGRKGGSAPVNSVANALFNACAVSHENEQMTNAWNEAQRVFTLGQNEPKTDIPEKVSTGLQILHYPSERWRDRLTVRPFAKGFFAFNEQGEMMINHAVIYRDVLANMNNSDDLASVLEKVYFERGISQQDKVVLMDQMKEFLMKAPLKDWFSDSFDALYLKMSFSNNQGRIFQPDRVMMYGHKTIVVHFHEDAHDKESIGILKGVSQVLRQMGQQVEAYLFDTSQMQALPLEEIIAAAK
ncbi:UvrD-helicase domain-containing protein [Catalinimonas niigatensis]|uniref:UvrD-helicase domain-containing protein n=1 Tax=Catalinimonas niigatensis TaxID=1397264 RepID=UPI00266593D6|nr:UvrD-helicase domain-containing protein [Catalinimonas niigatensis]WPP51328.1 UvrD-helicase domain-containing protein [Catalinimonas niigatensis]